MFSGIPDSIERLDLYYSDEFDDTVVADGETILKYIDINRDVNVPDEITCIMEHSTSLKYLYIEGE